MVSDRTPASLHRITLTATGTGNATRVEIDGVPLRGVERVDVAVSIDDPMPRVMIQLRAQVVTGP